MKSDSKRGEKVVGVLLTEEAWGDLEPALAPYAHKGPIGKFIYCRQVDPAGHYFVMVASQTHPDGTSFEAQISIPHHYVKLFIEATERSQIGFAAEE